MALELRQPVKAVSKLEDDAQNVGVQVVRTRRWPVLDRMHCVLAPIASQA